MLDGFPVPGYIGKYLTALTLNPVWEHVPKEDLDALEITGQGNFKFSFQKQFEAHYINRPLLIQDKEWAKVTFITIWEDNKWLIEKIKKLKEKIAALSENESWADDMITKTGTKTTGDTAASSASNSTTDTDAKSTDKGSDKSTILARNFGVTNTGQSDNNSQYGSLDKLESTPIATGTEEKLPDNLMSIEILANSLNQSKSFSGNKSENTYVKDNNSSILNKTSSTLAGLTNTKTDGLIITYSNTKSGNKAKDTIEFLKLEVPQFRKQFLKKFSVMFKG